MSGFHAFLTGISNRYRSLFGVQAPGYDEIFSGLAVPILTDLVHSDAPYHTIAHTLEVILAGEAILAGKQYYEGSVSPQDWLHTLVALLCHDVGYVKGVCDSDRPDIHQYSDGKGSHVSLSPTATGAALTAHHVDRSQTYVATQLAPYAPIDLAVVQWNIEMTRFPVPEDERYTDTLSLGALCRAADLVGQLSDPHYLQKLSNLFEEFEETGMNQTLGYQSPADLRASYPSFFQHVVQPFIQPSIRYLNATADGRKRVARLYTNIRLAKLAQPLSDRTTPHLRNLRSPAELIPWQTAEPYLCRRPD